MEPWYSSFGEIMYVICQVQLAYNVSYWEVETVIDHSECSPPTCNIDVTKNEQYCIFPRLNFTLVDLSRNYVNCPVRRTGKHGETTLILQRKLFVRSWFQDLTVFMDVEANPGPDQLLNEIVFCSAQDRVTGIDPPWTTMEYSNNIL